MVTDKDGAVNEKSVTIKEEQLLLPFFLECRTGGIFFILLSLRKLSKTAKRRKARRHRQKKRNLPYECKLEKAKKSGGKR